MPSTKDVKMDFRDRTKKKKFRKQLKNLLGFRPGKTAIYKLSLIHRSKSTTDHENNERLEYLGDAILDAIVGDYLFKKYPLESEGYLTEMRSKIVNRNSLNTVAQKMGLHQLTFYDKHNTLLRGSNIFGNTLEALIGAIYLDKGYKKTYFFIVNRLLHTYIDFQKLEHQEIDHKNKLYSWANKNKHNLEFKVIDEHNEGGRRLFTIGTVIDGEKIGSGKAFSKKKAGKIAAQDALQKMNIIKDS
ncbi:MAG TPA: ribonuclease III [Chitinophagaceae bacterium]|nr:ribonuclease III [Chitinophagaceae bacterium]